MGILVVKVLEPVLRKRGAPARRRLLRHTRVTCVHARAPRPVTAPRRRVTDRPSSPRSSPPYRFVAVGRRLPVRSEPTRRHLPCPQEKRRPSRPADTIFCGVPRAAVCQRLLSGPASELETIPRAEVGGLISVLNASPLKESIVKTSLWCSSRALRFLFPSCLRFPDGFISPASARPRPPRAKSH